MTNIVFYHGNCIDGTGAALAHMQAFKEHRPSISCAYKPIDYPNSKDIDSFDRFLNFKDLTSDETDPSENVFWFLDFTPSLDVLNFLLASDVRVIVIDHHATGADIIQSLYDDMTKTMPFDEFFYVNAPTGNLCGASLVALFSDQIVGFDSWTQSKKMLDNSYALDAGKLQGSIHHNIMELIHPTQPLSFFNNLLRVRDTWDSHNPFLKMKADGLNYYCFHHNLQNDPMGLAKVSGEKLEDAINVGMTIKSVYEKVVQNAIDDGLQTTVETDSGSRIHLLVTTCPGGQASLLGEMWYGKFPNEPAISVGIFYSHAREAISFGIRSNLHVNCRILAEHFGGGGHDRAAGGSFSEVAFADLPVAENTLLPRLMERLNAYLVETVEKLY